MKEYGYIDVRSAGVEIEYLQSRFETTLSKANTIKELIIYEFSRICITRGKKTLQA